MRQVLFQGLGQVVEGEVAAFLKELIDKSDLIEEMTPELARELVIALVHRAGFGGNPPCIGDVLRPFWDPRSRRPALPIELDQIEESILRIRYYYQFDLERSATKRKEERRSGRRGDSLRMTPEDVSWIEARAERAFREREPFTDRFGVYPDIERLAGVLTRAVATLRRNGWGVTASELVNIQFGDVDIWPPERKSEVQRAACALWGAFLREYQQLVEVNFPTLKGSFELYSGMPVRWTVLVEGWLPAVGGYGTRWGVTIVKSRALGQDNEVVTCDDVAVERDGNDLRVRVDGAEIEYDSLLRTSIRSSSSANNPLKVYLHTPLRDLVYDQIRQEFPAVRAELLRRYGIPRKGMA
jgi:hypothetical protein